MRRDILLSLSLILVPVQSAAGLPWTRVENLPATDIHSVQLHGTTLYAAGNDRVYLGADGGATWTATSPLGTRGAPLYAVIRTGNALWVGSAGDGVFRTTTNGMPWTRVNDGLTGLGADFVLEFVVAGTTLYAGTAGAGVFALDLTNPTTWTPFNEGLPVATAGTISTLVRRGTTLIAPAGGNGLVYRYPEGATRWQEFAIEPPLLPGFVATDLASDGTRLLLSSGARVYRSDDDAQTWTRSDDGLTSGSETFLAVSGSTWFAAVDRLNNSHRLFISRNAGESWQQIDEIAAYVYELEVAGDKLWAARSDGLWWTPLATTPVQPSSWSRIKSAYGR